MLHGMLRQMSPQEMTSRCVACCILRGIKCCHREIGRSRNVASMSRWFVHQLGTYAVDFVMNKFVISPDALNRFRRAASEVAPDVEARVSRWSIIKDDIASLRKRGFSYRAISELLSQNGISASPSGLMRFCRRVLKEKRSHKLSTTRRVNNISRKKSAPTAPAKTAPLSAPAMTPKSAPVPPEPSAFTSRGPRIAKVEQLPPGETI
jgi:hypothetical protein